MDTYLNNLNNINIEFSCEVVSKPSHVQDVYTIEQAVFSEEMQDSFSDLQAFFAHDDAHGLILRHGSKPAGVLKGHHIGLDNTDAHLLESVELKDTLDQTFYMDSVGVVEEVRSTKVLDFLMHEMAVDMGRFDYQFVTAHARIKGGLSRLYQRRYKAKVLCTYEDWCGFGESFDYILVDLRNVPVQSKLRRALYRAVRRFFAFFR